MLIVDVKIELTGGNSQLTAMAHAELANRLHAMLSGGFSDWIPEFEVVFHGEACPCMPVFVSMGAYDYIVLLAFGKPGKPVITLANATYIGAAVVTPTDEWAVIQKILAITPEDKLRWLNDDIEHPLPLALRLVSMMVQLDFFEEGTVSP